MMFPKPLPKEKNRGTKEWDAVRKDLKVEFTEKGITHCELGLEGCTYNWFLGFAHTTKRRYVRDLRRVVLACTSCHEKIEYEAKKWVGRGMEEYLESIIRRRI